MNYIQGWVLNSEVLEELWWDDVTEEDADFNGAINIPPAVERHVYLGHTTGM
jgi:uncharacterized protein YegJ (DUF2314 family)